MENRELKSMDVKSTPVSRIDRILAGTTVVTAILLIEANLAAGSLVIAQSVLDRCNSNLLENTIWSVDLMVAVAGIFILADIVVLIKLRNRKLRVRSKPVHASVLSPPFRSLPV